MNIAVLIDIYRMEEISVKTRISLIKKTGRAINDAMGMNITTELAAELILLLDPNYELDDNYKYYLNKEE